MSVTFRPHHFLCTLCFQGKGYSPSFVKNYLRLVEQLRGKEGDQMEIEVVDHADSICAPCPHRRDKSCTSAEKILQLDTAHAAILHLKPGDKLTWGEAKSRIKQFMTLEHFHNACEPCDWKRFGICEEVLTAFLKI